MAKKMLKKIAKKVTKKTAVQKSALSVGQQIPNFELPCTGGRHVSLQSLRGKKVVLYFYPKDCTPGCTTEGQDFTKLHKKFAAADTEIFGISRDTMALHEKFRLKENYSVNLLSDEQEVACKIFDVIKMKNMYGKSVRGIERSTFVLDAEGNLAREWRKVKVEGHAQEVLKFVQGL